MRIRDPTEGIVYFTGFTWSLFMYLIQTLFDFTRTLYFIQMTMKLLLTIQIIIDSVNTYQHHLATQNDTNNDTAVACLMFPV